MSPAKQRNQTPGAAGHPTRPNAHARLTSLLQEPEHPQKLRTWLTGQTPVSQTPYYVSYTARLDQEAMDEHKARLIQAAMAAGIQLNWIEQNIWGEQTVTTLYTPSAPPSSDSPPSSSS